MPHDLHMIPGLVTYDEYCQIPDDGRRYEVVDGVLSMAPAPLVRHQRIVGRLFASLYAFAEEKSLGEVFVSPLDVVLSDRNVVQPDILFISEERLSIVQKNKVLGSPDLVVEVLSEGNRKQDETVKLKLYQRFKVREYWIVDPVNRSIKIYKLVEGAYLLSNELIAEENDTLTSSLLPDFAYALTTLFR